MKTFRFHFPLLLLLAAMAFVFVSCDDDDDTKPIDLLPNINGVYVYGTNTVATAPGNAASKMNPASLDPNRGIQMPTAPGIFGKFIHMESNGTLKIAYVKDDIGKTYGTANGGLRDSALVAGGAINDIVIHGTLVDGGDPIDVDARGLYYLYVDINTETFILMQVKANMIGDATQAGWAAGTALPLKSSDTLKTVFEGTEIPLVGASGYRYRFNDGWHVFEGNEIVTLSSLGVPSYGEAWDSGINDIGFHLDNIPHKETGIFTITLTYDFKTQEWDEVKTKTGDLLVDYSDHRFGWFGNAYYVSGTTEGAWDAIHLIKTPEKDGNLYHWRWTLELIQGRSFVLREDADAGAWITYGGAAKLGSAFDNAQIVKEDGQDNYFVAVGGTYNVTFTINAEDSGRILTIEPN